MEVTLYKLDEGKPLNIPGCRLVSSAAGEIKVVMRNYEVRYFKETEYKISTAKEDTYTGMFHGERREKK